MPSIESHSAPHAQTPEQVKALAQLVESHRGWAEKTAASIVDSCNGVFDEQVFRGMLASRRNIAFVVDNLGSTAHTALTRLLVESGQRYAARTAEA